jgi:hypothetical protein
MEFNTEFLQFSMPRGLYYRLRVQMGDCSNMYGCRPDGQLCEQNF